VLFVDHHQAEVRELDVLLEQRMGADDDAGLAARGMEERLGARGVDLLFEVWLSTKDKTAAT
jgi:hypothetical protein